jgi:hypothetical protein
MRGLKENEEDIQKRKYEYEFRVLQTQKIILKDFERFRTRIEPNGKKRSYLINPSKDESNSRKLKRNFEIVPAIGIERNEELRRSWGRVLISDYKKMGRRSDPGDNLI